MDLQITDVTVVVSHRLSTEHGLDRLQVHIGTTNNTSIFVQFTKLSDNLFRWVGRVVGVAVEKDISISAAQI